MRPTAGWNVGKLFQLAREREVHGFALTGPAYGSWPKKITVDVWWAEPGDPGTIACFPELKKQASNRLGIGWTTDLFVRSNRAQVVLVFIGPQPSDWWPHENAFRAYAEKVFAQLEPRSKPCR